MRHTSTPAAPRRRHTPPFPLVLLAVLAAAAPAFGQVWTPVGPTDGEATSVDGSAATGDRLLAAAGGTLYRSADAGESWTPVIPFDIRRVVTSPADPEVVYAVGVRTSTYRSEDGGATWQPAGVIEDFDLRQLWADPDDPDVAYVDASQFIPFGGTFYVLKRTLNGGQTWDSILGLSHVPVIFDLAFSTGGGPSVLLVLDADGDLLRSEDHGTTFTRIEPDGLDDRTLVVLAGDPSTPGRLLASAFPTGLYESSDGGETWQETGLGLPGRATWLLFDPTAEGVVYAVTVGRGAYRSVDGGATWAPIGTGAEADRPEGWLFPALAGDPLRLFLPTETGVLAADPATIPPCVVGPATLCLEDGRFEARVAWEDFQNRAGEGQAVPLTAHTGAFWFFRDTNLELAVKVLDGTQVNGFFWNFYGSLSNVPFTLTIRDSATGDQRFYVNPPRTFASRGDTRGFPEQPLGAGDGLIAPGELIALGGDFGTASGATTGIGSIGLAGGTGGDCVPSATALCLQDGRFRVEVEWQDFQGGSGVGHGHPLTADTGAFWFFDDANLELFVKVLDATPVNGHFWVFYGSLSNVAFTMTVTDTVTGEPRVYENPARTFASRGDTAAF